MGVPHIATHKPFALVTTTIATAIVFMAYLDGVVSDSVSDAIEIGLLYEPVNLSSIAGGGQGITETPNDNVYKGLFRLADNGTIQPQLATFYSISENGLAYTFRLREGVMFSGGVTFDAANIVRSIDHVLAEDFQSVCKSQLAVINSIEAMDPQTLIMTLSWRSISLLYDLSYLQVVPEGFDLQTETGGTGPCTLDARMKGSTLALETREDYWSSSPRNGAITFHYYTNATAMTNVLGAGDIDVTTPLQFPDASTTSRNSSDFTVSEGTPIMKGLLAFNSAQAPFSDMRIRQAIYSAIDRGKLLKSIWDNTEQVIGSMVPPSDSWYEDLTSVNPYDPGYPKVLLAKTGAEGLSLTLNVPSYDPHPAVVEFVKSGLIRVGMTVTISTTTADGQYSKICKEYNFRVTLQECVSTRDVMQCGNPKSYWDYNSEAVTALIDEAGQASTEDEQTERLYAANEQIAANVASAWLYFYPQIVVTRFNMSGYGANGLDSQFFVLGISKK